MDRVPLVNQLFCCCEIRLCQESQEREKRGQCGEKTQGDGKSTQFGEDVGTAKNHEKKSHNNSPSLLSHPPPMGGGGTGRDKMGRKGQQEGKIGCQRQKASCRMEGLLGRER